MGAAKGQNCSIKADTVTCPQHFSNCRLGTCVFYDVTLTTEVMQRQEQNINVALNDKSEGLERKMFHPCGGKTD
jgi:hypothetical protein